MLKRLSLTALAAVAVLATAALTPASARGGHGGGGHGGGHFFRGGGHFHGGHAHVGHARYFGHRFAHFHPRWNWHWRHGSYGYRGQVYYDGGANYAVSTPAPAPVACPGNCLAKEYLPNGMVVFTDRCTNESAVAQTQPQTRG